MKARSDQPAQSSGLIDTQFDYAILAIHFVSKLNCMFKLNIIEPQHEISNNVVCATSKASDQPAHTCNLIRAFASPLPIL